MLINKKKNIKVVKKFKFFKKVLLTFYQKFKKLFKNFEKIRENYMKVCEKFYGQNIFTISIFPVLYTAEGDVCNFNF